MCIRDRSSSERATLPLRQMTRARANSARNKATMRGLCNAPKRSPATKHKTRHAGTTKMGRGHKLRLRRSREGFKSRNIFWVHGPNEEVHLSHRIIEELGVRWGRL